MEESLKAARLTHRTLVVVSIAVAAYFSSLLWPSTELSNPGLGPQQLRHSESVTVLGVELSLLAFLVGTPVAVVYLLLLLVSHLQHVRRVLAVSDDEKVSQLLLSFPWQPMYWSAWNRFLGVAATVGLPVVAIELGGTYCILHVEPIKSWSFAPSPWIGVIVWWTAVTVFGGAIIYGHVESPLLPIRNTRKAVQAKQERLLRGGDFRQAVLTHLQFERLDLASANFSGCNLRHTSLVGCEIADTNFAGANLDDADLAGCLALGANFEAASLRRANLSTVFFGGANLQGADLRHANMRACNLHARRRLIVLVGREVTYRVDPDDILVTRTDLRGTDLSEVGELNPESFYDVETAEPLVDDKTRFPPGFLEAEAEAKSKSGDALSSEAESDLG